jgi:formate--tetrahydrofolate ligase
MQSTIEKAQEAPVEPPLKPIREYLEELQLTEEDFEFYGKYSGKIRLEVLEKKAELPSGKLILVTAMTPTPSGEGKTLTTIGLGQALKKLGKKSIITLRQPSLGPVFGMKGGATGGGRAQVLPREKINLHFNGDFHAITSAHNLLAAMLDTHLFKGNDLQIDITNVLWNRTLDMNDRALRQIVLGLGGRVNGVPRESGFVITAASEVMAILALASSRTDLKKRLGEIVVALKSDGSVVKASDLSAHSAMAALLNEAILPNLVQTIEHTPAIIHAGPFANIAHGTNSILGDFIAQKLADYVVTECGFGADLGAEKFFHIVCRQAPLWPSALVLVATCRALKYHGGVALEKLNQENKSALVQGFQNVEAHLQHLKKFKVPLIVALNQFESDTSAEIQEVISLCKQYGVPCVPHTAFMQGGQGTLALAEKTLEILAGEAHPSPQPHFLYELSQSLEEKIQILATQVYGAKGVYFEKRAMKQLEKWTKLGYGHLPLCVAKTQSSLSDNPKALGAPRGWTLTVTDTKLAAGAGFIVLICGEMLLMPGLPKVPAAVHLDVDAQGKISGLF